MSAFFLYARTPCRTTFYCGRTPRKSWFGAVMTRETTTRKSNVNLAGESSASWCLQSAHLNHPMVASEHVIRALENSTRFQHPNLSTPSFCPHGVRICPSEHPNTHARQLLAVCTVPMVGWMFRPGTRGRPWLAPLPARRRCSRPLEVGMIDISARSAEVRGTRETKTSRLQETFAQGIKRHFFQ